MSRFFYGIITVPLTVQLVQWKSWSQSETTVGPADIRGLATTLLGSVGCLPRARPEGFLSPHNADEVGTKPRLRLFQWIVKTLFTLEVELRDAWILWGHRYLLSNGPHTSAQFPGDGHNYPIGVFAACAQLSIAFTEPP
jgi:hypothetical protein